MKQEQIKALFILVALAAFLFGYVIAEQRYAGHVEFYRAAFDACYEKFSDLDHNFKIISDEESERIKAKTYESPTQITSGTITGHDCPEGEAMLSFIGNSTTPTRFTCTNVNRSTTGKWPQ